MSSLERYYFISDDLDDLEHVEAELIAKGVAEPQIHVLSRDNAGVHNHSSLHGVPSLMKRDLLHSGAVGAAVGAVLGIASLVVAYLAGWTQSAAGWLPFVFLAAAVFGACTWIGGLWGVQRPNHHFQRFQSVLDEGRHVFFVDLDTHGRDVLEQICEAHPKLKSAGTGPAAPPWQVSFANKTQKWWYWRMWKDA